MSWLAAIRVFARSPPNNRGGDAQDGQRSEASDYTRVTIAKKPEQRSCDQKSREGVGHY